MAPVFDPALDLTFERVVEVPVSFVWQAWTTPDLIKQWFTPAPWTTVDCTIDLRPGGVFRTVMRSPEGQEMPNEGCILEVVPEHRLVWTNALGPGFRPRTPDTTCGEPGAFCFTATIALEAVSNGTRYTATVLHADGAGRERHAAMGFEHGWGAALAQLVALAKKSPA